MMHTTPDQPRVLLVRPTALGDVSRTVPALVSLRRAMPEATIDWLVNDAYADVVRYHPALNGVVPFPRKQLGRALTSPTAAGELRRWVRELRARRYTHVFDLQGLLRSGLITRLTGAGERIGFANAREFGWMGYNRRYNIDASLHAVDRMLALLKAHGLETIDDMRLYVGETDRQWWREQRAASQAAEGDYVVIAPTARWLCKCWPIDRYAHIARQLMDDGRAGRTVVVLASPAEQAGVQPLIDAISPHAKVLVPETTVGRMMAVLADARIVLCNDSAPLHIAVGLDRPVVTIFGPTNPALVGPYRRENSVVQPASLAGKSPSLSDYRRRPDDQSLIAQVTVEQVWERVTQTLGG